MRKIALVILHLLFLAFAIVLIFNNKRITSIDDNSIPLSGGRWPSRIITYTITPGTEYPIANAWVNAANEINRYNIVDFVITPSGDVSLGQQITPDDTELGVTQNWRNGTIYTRSVASLTANASLKNAYRGDYAQRQYATALHEFGHILGLKHNDNPASIMYYASRTDVYSLDSDYLAAIRGIYGVVPSGIKSEPITINVKGTLQVNFAGSGGINVWKTPGAKWTGRRLNKYTKWKFYIITNYNGRNWYNLGGNQWVDGSYIKQI